MRERQLALSMRQHSRRLRVDGAERAPRNQAGGNVPAVLHFPHMARTRLSPKYQVVIPKEVRESIGLEVGQEFQIVSKGGVITLVPERPLSSLRGFAKGIRTDKLREKKDRV